MTVQIFSTRSEMGAAAAADVAHEIRRRLSSQDRVRMVFAAAPSQQEMLDALVAAPGIDWSRVIAFHMDDYVDLRADAPERFAAWLQNALFSRVAFGQVHVLRTDGDADAQAAEYASLLDAAPIDIVCCGIGVNGHLAFNDPPVADLADPLDVKVVELDEVCRQQQVDDGCFPTLEDVPRRAVTLTVPRLLRADRIFCVVPGAAKAPAVRATLHDSIGTACPATALRTHAAWTLYLDPDSASALDAEAVPGLSGPAS